MYTLSCTMQAATCQQELHQVLRPEPPAARRRREDRAGFGGGAPPAAVAGRNPDAGGSAETVGHQ